MSICSTSFALRPRIMDPGRERAREAAHHAACARQMLSRPKCPCNCALAVKYKRWNGQPIWDSVDKKWFAFMCPHVMPSTPPSALLFFWPERYKSSSSPFVDELQPKTFKRKLEDVEEVFDMCPLRPRIETISLAALPATPTGLDLHLTPRKEQKQPICCRR